MQSVNRDAPTYRSFFDKLLFVRRMSLSRPDDRGNVRPHRQIETSLSRGGDKLVTIGLLHISSGGRDAIVKPSGARSQ